MSMRVSTLRCGILRKTAMRPTISLQPLPARQPHRPLVQFAEPLVTETRYRRKTAVKDVNKYFYTNEEMEAFDENEKSWNHLEAFLARIGLGYKPNAAIAKAVAAAAATPVDSTLRRSTLRRSPRLALKPTVNYTKFF
jgi:hypothetical protein